ncbi:unnamed protein product [Bursaphelenchus xylophilus]|uniref:(pine wood nematode) hypothetical protein n=1 Tax=Bursaphelenchus xylophilus TaxID=6326 RepID=A0A1I7RXV6_BURXY|nr:unnamed protein product [Bursaphelenchus xylophilus]CAG9125195.1 unnamed protein product [Bursaphelenchus xylophilus]
MLYIEYGEECFYRHVFPSPQGYVSHGDSWLPLGRDGVKPETDFVQVSCAANNVTTYKFVHYQVYKRPEISPRTTDSTKKRPDVHILVIDSASMPQVRRALPKTVKYIAEEMGAQFFLFHSKKAADTMGQSHALLMGKVTEKLWARPGSESYPHMDIMDVGACAENSTYVLKTFRDRGYKVLMSEDWTTQKFMSCKDEEELAVDHYMSVYWLKMKQIFPFSHVSAHFGPAGRIHYHPNMWEKFCIERHFQMWNYLEDFMEKYKNFPQLTVTWLGHLTHDYRGDLFKYDDDFLEFFKRMKNKTKNSHFFFLGDHGNRIYSDKSMFWDRVEDKNPAFFYIPPQSIQKNKAIMKRVKQNSQQLVSTMDIHATLVDILKNVDDFDSPIAPNMPEYVVGSSVLRELSQPRNCDTLELSFEYCMCETFGPRTQNHSLSHVLANAAVRYMNDFIQASNDSDICAPLELSKDFKPYVEEYRPEEYKDKEERIYIVTLKTHPGNALYMPHISVSNNGTMKVVSYVGRKNAFGHQARCINDRYKVMKYMDNLCFCKNLLNDEREVNKVNN